MPQTPAWQQAPGAAAGPDATQGARTLGLVFLAITLLLALGLPLMTPGEGGAKAVFANFIVLGEADCPFLAKVMFLYPGLAGIVTFVLALVMRNVGRSIILLALGIGAFVLPLLDERVALVMQGLVNLVGPDSPIFSICALLGTVGLYAGSRARCFRPMSLAAALLAAVGGALFIASLVIPFEGPGGKTTIPIVLQFEMLGDRLSLLSGVVSLVCTALALFASILCFINIPLSARGGGLGKAAFWLFFVSLMLGTFGVSFVNGLQGGRLPSEFIPAVLLSTVKCGCWTLGLTLLVAAGLADLIVNVSGGGAPAAAGAPAAGAYGAPAAAPYGAPAAYAPRPAAPAPAPYAPRPAAPAGPPPGGPADDPMARLERLRDLFSRGLISPEEYEQKKNEILSRM
ncbi:MAG: SHOCT domain-containing protein [Planctomycetes bacterium]|nr:SHOCT domain-containing protein [Planctomycetota bacterium]